MPNNYCDADDIKAAMPDQSWPDTSYDALLDVYATRASREFDRATNRHPGAYAVTTASDRYFTGSGGLYLYPGEMAEAPSAVAVAETGELGTLTSWSTASDYRCIPYNAADEGQPYMGLEIDITSGTKGQWPRFPKAVKVTAKWGYSSTVPDEVQQAVITMAVRFFKRGQQGFEDIGARSELGQLRYVAGQDPMPDRIIEFYRRQAV